MLTVWIDDSKGQDGAVLEHMKQAQARRRGEKKTDTSASVCQGIWTNIKQQILYVRITFSPRVCFCTSANRRNPNMLFDLIKCHAPLHCCQRDEEGSIIASHVDYNVCPRALSFHKRQFRGTDDKTDTQRSGGA